MREVLDNALIAENEQQIQTLRCENLILKEQLLKITSKQATLDKDLKSLTEKQETKLKAME